MEDSCWTRDTVIPQFATDNNDFRAELKSNPVSFYSSVQYAYTHEGLTTFLGGKSKFLFHEDGFWLLIKTRTITKCD